MTILFSTRTRPADIITQGLDMKIGIRLITISDCETFFPPFSQRKDDVSEICCNGDTNTRMNAAAHENGEICRYFRSKILMRMCVCV